MIEIRQSLVTIRYSETLILVDISRACCSAFKGIIQQRLEKSPAVMDGFEDGTTYQGISQVFLFFTRHDFPMKTHLLLFPMTQEIFGDVGVPWTGDYNGYGLDAVVFFQNRGSPECASLHSSLSTFSVLTYALTDKKTSK